MVPVPAPSPYIPGESGESHPTPKRRDGPAWSTTMVSPFPLLAQRFHGQLRLPTYSSWLCFHTNSNSWFGGDRKRPSQIQELALCSDS